ncbi:MAG: heme ABC transporter ATP-binding protein [Hyphomicrobiales bacterium]|nr:heme ABC transporter ATP-binding protein [Hyphomicrobiales bacterium]
MSLRLENASFSVGEATLLRGVDIEVRPGRFTVVMGPNGAGKSTALAILAGDLPPSKGAVFLDGEQLHLVSAERQAERRAVVTQNQPADFPLTALEVAMLGRAPCRAGRARDLEAVTAALEATGAAHLASRHFPTLSGGERQRVQIARALAQIWDRRARAQSYLLMDEPTASLDLKHQIATLDIARAFADAGAGVMCILHDVVLAREFADEVVLLRRGEVFASGPPASTLTCATLAAVFDLPLERAAAYAVSPPS